MHLTSLPRASATQKKYNLHLKGFVGGSDIDRDYVDYVLGRNAKQPMSMLIDSTGDNPPIKPYNLTLTLENISRARIEMEDDE